MNNTDNIEDLARERDVYKTALDAAEGALKEVCDDLITERDGLVGEPLAIDHDRLRFDHVEKMHQALTRIASLKSP